MNARMVGRIERGVELIASALFACAVGFAAFVLLQSIAGPLELRLLAGGAALAAFLLSGIAIRAAPNFRASFALIAFDLPQFESFESNELLLSAEDQIASGELLLTDEDRIENRSSRGLGEPLLLDDVLAQMGPDSRVVRLFDRNSMPTPGQLQSKIDNHLGHRRPAATPDASQALSEALAELRRSLR